MEIKSLDKRGEEGIKISFSKMIKLIKQKIEYYIFAMKVNKVDIPMSVKKADNEIVILNDNYTYIQILPIGKNYSLTMSYNEIGEFIAWYFNITASNFLDERGMPFYEELYLSILLTKDREIFIQNQEELENALSTGKITENQYSFAIREAELLKLKVLENFNYLCTISKKYYSFFVKQNTEKLIEPSNTYRVNIKPGIKVAIVLKKDQKTGILTEGIVKDILTNSVVHHRGIKVRLTDGQVGRVQKIL